MPHPTAPLSARSPYDAGLSYFMDEYSGDGGYGDASRLGIVPSQTAIPSSSSEDQNTLNSVLNVAKTIWQNWTAGAARDAQREARAKLIMQFAISGSVLAAQICYAGPDNVASNEDPYWTGAQQAIQTQRPDVWSEALVAGKWWPVGEQFDMLKERAQMAAALAAVGITVNQAAITQSIGTSDVPFSVTVAPGVAAPPTGGGQTGGGAPVAKTGTSGTGGTATPLVAGSTSPILLLGLVGAAVYVATRSRGA
jgi:hypothetical protein